MIVPPEEIDAGPLTLFAYRGDEAPELHRLVTENIEHLRPWMPWASADTAEADQEAFVRRSVAERASGDAFGYSMREAGTNEMVGAAGLLRRIGPGALEIGYWVSASRVRRGYATASARALTSAALALDGVDRVEIHCDEANVASAAVPRRLGFRLDRVADSEREAPGESGREMVWVVDSATWLTAAS